MARLFIPMFYHPLFDFIKMIVWICLIILVVGGLLLWISTLTFTQTVNYENGSFLSTCAINPCGPGLVCDNLQIKCLKDLNQSCITSFDCANNTFCGNQVCIQSSTGGLNDPCPCGTGFICIGEPEGFFCKTAPFYPCTSSPDCANNNCVNGTCSSGLPDGYVGCRFDNQCASQKCVNGACANSDLTPFGTLGAPCGEGCVNYPTTSCNSNLSCQCQSGTPGVCVQTDLGLLLPCDSTSLCTSTLSCSPIGMCEYPFSNFQSLTPSTITLYEIDFTTNPLIGSTTFTINVLDSNLSFFPTMIAAVNGGLYGVSSNNLYQWKSGWQLVRNNVQTISSYNTSLYYSSNNNIYRLGSTTDSLITTVPFTVTNFSISSASDVIAVNSQKNAQIKLGTGGTFQTLTYFFQQSTQPVTSSKVLFYPGTGTNPNLTTCQTDYLNNQGGCLPSTNFGFLTSDNKQLIFNGNAGGFTFPQNLITSGFVGISDMSWSTTNSDFSQSTSIQTYDFGSYQLLFVAVGNLGTYLPYQINRPILTAVVDSKVYVVISN